MLGFRTFRARRRLVAANAAFQRARLTYAKATARQDTRAMGDATGPLQAACRERLEAEIALAAVERRAQPAWFA